MLIASRQIFTMTNGANAMYKKMLDGLIDGSVNFVRSDVTSVRRYAFSGCTSIQVLDLPNVTAVYYQLLASASACTLVNLPSVVSIAAGVSLLYSCKNGMVLNLDSLVDLSASTYMCGNSFDVTYNLPSLETINLTGYIGYGGFGGTVNIPKIDHDTLLSQPGFIKYARSSNTGRSPTWVCSDGNVVLNGATETISDWTFTPNS